MRNHNTQTLEHANRKHPEQNMTLDDIRRIDTGGMYDAVCGFPKQWQDGRARAVSADFSGIRRDGYRNVVVVGMGGSAIGGDLLRTLALDEAAMPVVVSRSYRLPAWVGPETAVIASSYSGNTEETLAALDEALRRRASVICITTGGTLHARASAEGLPCVLMPGGLQPRAALGYSLTALLTVAEHMDLLTPNDDAWTEAQALVEAQAAALADPEAHQNQALDIATALQGRLPVVYSSEGLFEGVNLRWRNQMHENSKTHAVGNVFPELNHNEIMGWARRTDLLSAVGVVVLRDHDDHPRVQHRIDVTRALLADYAACWMEVHSRGTSKLARLLSLIYLGDWVSLYLAVLNQVDPTPIRLISQLKEALADLETRS